MVYAKGALSIVNRTRKLMGMTELEDLPKGIRKKPLSCPLANALPDDAEVQGNFIYFADEDTAKALAKVLKETVINRRNEYPWNMAEKVSHIPLKIRKRPWQVRTIGTSLDNFVQAFDAKKPGFEQYAGNRKQKV